ncbi:MAG: hypothetical protein ACRD4D_04880 [Candidatus Acidiferrales bacterium]
MTGRGPFRVGAPFLLSLVCVASLLITVPAAGQGSKRWSWRMLQDWLKSEHEKVVKDSDRIAVLARNLRHEVDEMPETSASHGLRERTRKLEATAQQLREAVEGANENFLSVPVVNLANEIRDQARSLRKVFEDHPARRKLERFRQFCREIEQRAEAVRKRASAP